MPKDMFLNISKEKQENFLKAATKEFTHKSYEQASVNSIIKEANISRGSFYNYFDDLDSLFEYLFEAVKEKRYHNSIGLVKESNRDLFVFIEKVFRSDYKEFRTEGTYSLFRNYIHFVRNKKNRTIKEEIIIPLWKTLNNSINISTAFDLSWINVPLVDLIDVLEMTMIIVIDLFIMSETLDYSEEKTMELFSKRINIIKKGIS